jgi:S1-C subfamily serine protease
MRNLSTGTIAATTSLADDTRFMQVSAPAQPGDTGSPLLDSGGDVIGVMEAKLDAAKTLRMVGDIPENVNFAIRGSEAVQYHGETTESTINQKVADIAAKAVFSADLNA